MHPAAAPAAVDVTRWARLLQMADARRIDTTLLRDMLATGPSAERAAAARAVGQVHARALAPDLRRLLDDRDTAVAANAAYALGLLADTSAVASLAGALAHGAPVSLEAAWALGQIGAPARDTILAALRDPFASGAAHHDAATTGALLLAAARLRPAPVEAITPWLANDSASIRWRAVYVVARPYAAAGVRRVLPLANDPSAEVRAQVARAAAYRAAGDSLRPLALDALHALVRDDDPHVRINALRSIASYGDIARAAVVGATHDTNANVRITAAQELGHVLGSARKAWMQAWDADTSFMYQRSVLVSAASQDVILPKADEDNPDGWRHQGDWRLRAAVADAAAASPTVLRLREVGLPLVRDPDERVREAAYAAMAPHADTAQDHPWRREFMYEALKDWDFSVRALGIASLEGHATAAEVPLVLSAYRLAQQKDSVSDAKIEAVRFFAAAWRHDSVRFADSTKRALAALPAPDDPLVRAAADDLPLLASWRTAPMPDSLHPVTWYEQRVRTLIVPALAGTLPHARLHTDRGVIDIELYALDAPLTVDNFLTLTRAGYFDGTRFHRVVPNFVAQGGDRRGDGNGGPPYTIRDELNRRRYTRGAVGMALSGPDTGGSQFFLTLSPQPHLDGGYTVFGRIVAGQDVADALVQGDHVDHVDVP